MVGFKFFTLWTILIASMVMSGCVPQAKQTECSSNEAFSPTQRKCLPVNPSETSFIKIRSAVPSGGITQTASSGSEVSFSFMIENPYNKQYRVRWIRNFNGAQTTLYTPSQPSSEISDHPHQITLVPSSDLFGAVGNHIITAQILDAVSSNVLDSHDFTLTLTTEPVPNGQGFSPGLSTPIIYNPINTDITFNFSFLRNGRSLDVPRVRWTLTKLTGVSHTSRVEMSPTLLNINEPQPVHFIFNPSNPFNEFLPAPAAPFENIVGNYRLEATILDGANTFSTYYWDITIRHPDLGVITNANLPAPGSSFTVKAYNGITYANPDPTSFSYSGNNRAQFCVRVSNPSGRYGQGVRVRFYQGSSTDEVWSDLTNALDDTICLDDAPVGIKDAIRFDNPNPDATWITTIVARVFDEQTNEEFKSYPAGSYPLTWSVQVVPQNRPPVLSFVDTAGSVACDSTLGTTRNNCHITQSNINNTNTLRVAFDISDDHYSNGEDFQYTAYLYRGAAAVSSCSKALGVAAAAPYTCDFTVPSYDSNGSINPEEDQWRVTLQVTDRGSPFPTSGQKSSSLIWNLKVREINDPPTLTSPILAYLGTAPTMSFTEKDTINFRVQLNDPERDKYILELARCGATLADSDCNTILTTTDVLYSGGLNDYNDNRRLAYTIPDGFIPANVENQTVTFRIKIIDYASTANATPLVSNQVVSSIDLLIENYNPEPKFANLAAIDTTLPSGGDPLGIDYVAFSSFPLTLDPGTITDDSEIAEERKIVYKWWIAPHSVTPTWSEIDGASSRVLSWTPGNIIASGNYFIKLCITDGYPPRNNLDPNLAGAVCNNPAIVSVNSNFISMPAIDINATPGGQLITDAPAVWIDTTATGDLSILAPAVRNSRIIYSAYVVGDQTVPVNFRIHVQKSVYNYNGTGQMQLISELVFDAIDPEESSSPDFELADVKDLRITGDEDSLYIAYLANRIEASESLGYRPEIRRIYKGIGRGEKSGSNIHSSPFAFNYEGFFVNHDQVACLACWDGNDDAVDRHIQTGSVVLDTANVDVGSVISLGYAAGAYTFNINVAGVDPTNIAINITDTINTSSELGFTAIHNGGNTVTIFGPMRKEKARVEKVTNKLGRIWMDQTSNNYLYIPYIDLSAAAPNNKILTVEAFQNDPSASLFTVSQGAGVSSRPIPGTYSHDFDNDIDHAGNTLFVYTDLTGNAKIIKFDGVDFNTRLNEAPILPTKNIEKIKLSASNAHNNFYYIMAQAPDEKIFIARLEANLAMADFNRVWSLTSTNDTLTSNLVTSLDGEVYDFAILAADTDKYSVATIAEARILISSSQGIYAFKALDNNTVSCGNCAPVNQVGSVVSANAPNLGVSGIIENEAITSPGNISPSNNEHIRDIMAFTYIDHDSVANENGLKLGIINTERILIDSTTPDEINGFFGAAIFKY